MEFLKNAVIETIPMIVTKIVEHAAYPFQLEDKIRDLESATRDLVAIKDNVKKNIINAERECNTPTKQVEEWLNKVEAIEKDALRIPENYHKRRRSVWSDYTISRSAVKKLREVKSLCDQRKSIEVTIYIPPPLAQEMSASSSKSSNLGLALEHIKDDVHDIIGIYGMGGVGKTHLLKQINNELYKDNTFDMVIFITCSKECSEEKIQNEVIDKLGLNKSTSVERKRSTIFNFLKNKSFVLLLDDLWSRMDLEIVGIPIPVGLTSRCKGKIVVATRSIRVCGLMEVKKKIKVNILNWNGAWNLFKEKVTEETIVSHPLIQKYAVEVVKELGGLPLALITVGRAMYDRTDPSEWELAIELLKQARLNDLVLGTDEMYNVLKFSYDKLRNDKLRECFLHCTLWPEDYEIEKHELVELWMGLGLIDERDINTAYNVGYNYIRELQAVCLLEVTNRESHVKLHDIIRDMSLWIVSSQGVEKNKWIIQSGAAKNTKGIDIHMETEKILLMFQQSNLYISCPSGNTKLKTLLFTRSSLFDMKALPHLSFSELTVLNLQRNRFRVFPIEVCNLISLQFIDLSYNEIYSVPDELGALVNLKYLFMKENNIHVMPVGTISKMKALRVLYITLRRGYYKRAMRSKLEFDFVLSLLEELQSSPSFGALGIEVVDMMQFRKLCDLSNVPVRWLTVTMWEKLRTFSFSDWFLQTSLSRSNLFSLSIENMEVDVVKFESRFENQSSCQLGRLEDLHIMHIEMKEIIWKHLEPKNVLPRLKFIKIWNCNFLTCISWVVYLPCLRQLQVSHCRSIKQLISGNNVSEPTFPFLKQLILGPLDELGSICEPEITFPALESLTIAKCKKLKNLPFRIDNIPPKLNCIWIEEKCWNNIECDESNLKSSLAGFVRFTSSLGLPT